MEQGDPGRVARGKTRKGWRAEAGIERSKGGRRVISIHCHLS